MDESKIRGLMYFLISVALIYTVTIYLPSTTTISILWSIADVRTKSTILKENGFNAGRVTEKRSPQLRDFSKRYSDENDIKWRIKDIEMEGNINASRNYAIFSASTDYVNAQDTIFYLPLTTLAWKRIGFDSVILMVGSSKKSFSDPLVRYVLSKCLELDAAIIYIYSPPEYTAITSEVGRLFAANMLSKRFPDIDLVYFVISDVDVWPLHSDIYRLRSDMAMLALDIKCCSEFIRNDVAYMVPFVSNIGMRVVTWNKLAMHDSFMSKSSQNILTIVRRVFGSSAIYHARKKQKQSWYLYQMTISILMGNWISEFGSSHVMYIPRDTAVDRLDCCQWTEGSSVEEKIDVHMPLKGLRSATWKSIVPLLRTMYDNESERYNWSLSYYNTYADYCGQSHVYNST